MDTNQVRPKPEVEFEEVQPKLLPGLFQRYGRRKVGPGHPGANNHSKPRNKKAHRAAAASRKRNQ